MLLWLFSALLISDDSRQHSLEVEIVIRGGTGYTLVYTFLRPKGCM